MTILANIFLLKKYAVIRFKKKYIPRIGAKRSNYIEEGDEDL
jgi:hypothetical protein